MAKKKVEDAATMNVVRVPRALVAEADGLSFDDLCADRRFTHEPTKAKYPGRSVTDPKTLAPPDTYERDYSYFRDADAGDVNAVPHLYVQMWSAVL